MRVSAIRFGADLWRLLETEAALAGVSVSQYVREAALTRAAAAAAARGENPFELLGSVAESEPVRPTSDPRREHAGQSLIDRARAATSEARATRDAVHTSRTSIESVQEGAIAVRAQSQQAKLENKRRRTPKQSD